MYNKDQQHHVPFSKVWHPHHSWRRSGQLQRRLNRHPWCSRARAQTMMPDCTQATSSTTLPTMYGVCLATTALSLACGMFQECFRVPQSMCSLPFSNHIYNIHSRHGLCVVGTVSKTVISVWFSWMLTQWVLAALDWWTAMLFFELWSSVANFYTNKKYVVVLNELCRTQGVDVLQNTAAQKILPFSVPPHLKRSTTHEWGVLKDFLFLCRHFILGDGLCLRYTWVGCFRLRYVYF